MKNILPSNYIYFILHQSYRNFYKDIINICGNHKLTYASLRHLSINNKVSFQLIMLFFKASLNRVSIINGIFLLVVISTIFHSICGFPYNELNSSFSTLLFASTTRYTTMLSSPLQFKIFSRSMYRNSLKQSAHLLRPKKYYGFSQQNPYATYRIDNADVKKTTHEQAQFNPILAKKNGDTFQHPPYVRSVCEIPNCKDTLCNKPCGTIIEKADVGHATHSSTYPGVTFVSYTDSKGDPRTEYMKRYNPPIENTTGDNNINEDKTKNLQNNQEALHNVHVNSSKEPTQKAYTGSNDPTNIN